MDNDNELDELFGKKEELKTYLATNDNTEEGFDEKKDELETILEEIAEKCAQKNKDIIDEYFGSGDDGLDGFNQAKTWALKNKLSPKNADEPPMAKKDSKGNLITDKKLLEKVYMDTYIERLKPNKMAPGLENLEKLRWESL